MENERAEATKNKINDMKARLENLRKRKMEEEASEVAEVEELQSPPKKSHQEVAPEPAVPAQPAQVEVINLDDSMEMTEVQPAVPSVLGPASPDAPAAPSEMPLVTLLFRDKLLAERVGQTVREAVTRVLSQADLELFQNSSMDCVEVQIFEKEVRQQAGELFMLDTTPSHQESKQAVPAYSQSFTVPMTGEEIKPEEENNSAISCFNCGGAHMIFECQMPYNEAAVAERKAKFMADKKNTMQGLKTRYHLDGEQRYSTHRPGQLSEQLRNALGLRPNQLPMHIYQMRVFGYPPGWLLEAKQTSSGIKMLDDNNGPQEMTPESYDTSKIIEYPGYNVDAPNGFTDEARLFGMPPRQPQFSKEAMIDFMQSNSLQSQPYQPKKPRASKGTSDDDVMIINSSSNSQGSTKNGPNSPDIEVLEMKKNEILRQLGGDSPASPPVPPGTDDAPTFATPAAKTSNVGNGAVETPASPPRSPEPQTPECVTIMSTPETSRGRSVSLSIGTPLVKSASPFEKLPPAQAFSLGVSEHLNFENLPGTVGKYEKMKDIINKAKKVVDQL